MRVSDGQRLPGTRDSFRAYAKRHARTAHYELDPSLYFVPHTASRSALNNRWALRGLAGWVCETAGMQGSSAAVDRVLLDAAALCGHLVPAGSVYAFPAEHRQRVFPDELFADLFPSGRGRPSIPADVIATARKHDIAILDALRDAFTGSPWLPPAPAAT